jgi:hypothetical protein
MSDSAISVLHLSERDEEALLDTRKQIAGELESGRDVVLVLDEPVSRRAERLTVASLFLKNCRGRFAVVSEDAQPFSQLPQVIDGASSSLLHQQRLTCSEFICVNQCESEAKQAMTPLLLNDAHTEFTRPSVQTSLTG